MLVGADDQRSTTPRGSCRATAGMLMRLSTRGNAVSGTTYSPGVSLPATAPAGWIRPAGHRRRRRGVGGVSGGGCCRLRLAVALPAPACPRPSCRLLRRAFAAGFAAAAFLAESPPRSCSTAEGLPVAVSPLMPRPRRVRSIAGRAFSSALVLSVIRNSRNALRCTMALARAGSVMPASSTTMRSSPAFWTSGSSMPNSSIRFRSTVSARSRSRLGSAETCFDWSSSSARCMPPWRSRPCLSGTRVIVVSRMTPLSPRSRRVRLRGKRK